MGTIYKSGINYSGGGGSGVPAGGTAGQALVKKSDTDQDVEWKDVQEKVEAGWNLVKDADGKTLSVHDSVSYNIPDSNGYAVFVRSRPMKQDGTRGFVDLAVDNTPVGSTAVTTRENENTVTKFLQEKIVAGNGLTLAADGKTLHTNFFGQNGIQVSNTDRTIKLTDDIYNKIINNTADYGTLVNLQERAVGRINFSTGYETVYERDIVLMNPGEKLRDKIIELYDGIWGFSESTESMHTENIIDYKIIGATNQGPIVPGGMVYSKTVDSLGEVLHSHMWVFMISPKPYNPALAFMLGLTNGQQYKNLQVTNEELVSKTSIFVRLRYTKNS